MQILFSIGIFFIVVAILGTASGGVGGGIVAITGVVLIFLGLIGQKVWGSSGNAAAAPAAAPRDHGWMFGWVILPLVAIVMTIVVSCLLHFYWYQWSWTVSIIVAVIMVGTAFWAAIQPAQALAVAKSIGRGLVLLIRVLWAIPLLRWSILGFIFSCLFFRYVFWPWVESL